VLDSGLDGHSVFTGYLLRILRDEVDGPTTATDIGVRLGRRVAGHAAELGHQQTPLFSPVKGQGDFIFLPRPRS
jgi:hypothetical protein